MENKRPILLLCGRFSEMIVWRVVIFFIFIFISVQTLCVLNTQSACAYPFLLGIGFVWKKSAIRFVDICSYSRLFIQFDHRSTHSKAIRSSSIRYSVIKGGKKVPIKKCMRITPDDKQSSR